MDADSEREEDTAMEEEAPCSEEPDIFLVEAKAVSVPEIFLEPTDLLSSEISLVPSWPTILSLETVLLRTRGDFWASSWLAFRRLEEADMADSCLLSDMAVAEEAVTLECDSEDLDCEENCLLEDVICFDAEEICLDSDAAICCEDDVICCEDDAICCDDDAICCEEDAI